MKKFYFVIFLGFAKVAWAQENTSTVPISFEPMVTVCHKTEGQWLECNPLSNDESSQIQIPILQTYVVNGIEIWNGEFSREFTADNYKVQFGISLTLQKLVGGAEKTFEFTFHIKDSFSGASTYSVATGDLNTLSRTLIQLPEFKKDNAVYFVSLRYGPPDAKTPVEEKIPLVAVEGVNHYRMGDLILEKESLGEVNVLGTRPLRVDLWEDGVLPIVFKNDVSQELQDVVWSACKEWSEAANVKCVHGPYKNRQLVISRKYFGQDGGCWSMLGQSAYFLWIKRRMNLGQGCESYATVLHELGHAFGIGHEHQRPDRDQYLQVLKENISDPYLGLNTKMNFSTQAGQTLGEYDFLSIMQYSRKAFSKNGKDTLFPGEAYQAFAEVMGHAKHLSELDKVAIQKLYGVPKK